jgi:Tfp pilus assembly protein PilZ
MLEDTAEARLRCSSISLEDGADEAWLNGEPIGFCEGGICFPSRWQFDQGTILSLTLEICGTGERARAEGIVAWCEPAGERLWTVTVLFLEIPAGMAKIRNSKLEILGDFRGNLLR